MNPLPSDQVAKLRGHVFFNFDNDFQSDDLLPNHFASGSEIGIVRILSRCRNNNGFGWSQPFSGMKLMLILSSGLASAFLPTVMNSCVVGICRRWLGRIRVVLVYPRGKSAILFFFLFQRCFCRIHLSILFLSLIQRIVSFPFSFVLLLLRLFYFLSHLLHSNFSLLEDIFAGLIPSFPYINRLFVCVG